MRPLPIYLPLAVAGCLLLSGPQPKLSAQDAGPPAPSPPLPSGESHLEPKKALETLRALRESIEETEAELKEKREQLANATTPAEQTALGTDIQALNEKLSEFKIDLNSVAAGIDYRSYLARPGEEVDFSDEMEDFLSPIVSQLKELTARPREIDELKKIVAYHAKRKQLAGKAVEYIAKLLDATSDPAASTELESLRNTWSQRLAQAENNLTIAQFQLDAKLEEKGTVFHSVSEATGTFFKTRGRNLLVAALAFLVVFSALRLIHRLIHRLSPMRRRGRRSILVRVVDISYYVFTVIASLGVVLFVFYATDDWLLLGLGLLFLAGLAWAGKHTLPLFYEQGKLMLNLGSVREGERVVYNGIPWKVEAINIFTDLTNTAIQGGRLRIPLRDLVPLVSRPFEPKEPWFPSEEDDWVILSDETFGKVVTQTPEWVQMVKLGGSRKTYATAEFIALNPENLSRNFRIRTVFGIDYQHQATCSLEIPKVFQERLESEIESFVGEGNLLNLAVEFREAGASSLDYEILADLTGETASSFKKIERMISRICVDVCNENGWVIPFTQITLHQAAPVGEAG